MSDPPHRPRRLFALVDCSAFYASCERAFDPSLRGRPVAVLSNNDGCVIAATDEVKAAGVQTGEPYFKCCEKLDAIGAAVYSSNYALYADMSLRVMAALRTFTPDVEVYSIDEAFLPLREAVSTHAARAAEKLRREGLAAGFLHAFVTTKEHGAGPHKTCAAACGLGHPTNRTPELIRAAVRLLEGCYEEADWRRRPYRHRKAGVMLTELTRAQPEQGRLFVAPSPETDALMKAVDAVNGRFGGRAVVFGAMGVPKRLKAIEDAEGERPVWGMRRQHMSPRYTTRWDELVVVRA